MTDIVERLRNFRQWNRVHRAYDAPPITLQAADEIARLRAIVRVNGLRWGHSHAEIDAILAGTDGEPAAAKSEEPK